MKNTTTTRNATASLPAMTSLRKQQGWTMWGLLISISITVFFAYIVMQLVPVYSQNSSVQNAMNVAFDRADNIRTLNRNKYINLVERQLYLDEAHRDLPFSDLIKFRRDKRAVIADIQYSKIVPLFFNISLKVDFNESVSRPLN